jgi:hypothetical protein
VRIWQDYVGAFLGLCRGREVGFFHGRKRRVVEVAGGRLVKKLFRVGGKGWGNVSFMCDEIFLGRRLFKGTVYICGGFGRRGRVYWLVLELLLAYLTLVGAFRSTKW